MTKVKICGITTLEDAQYCASCGVDFLGFIFYKKSPRFISPAKAKRIIKKISVPVRKVGVFVNEEAKAVKKVAADCGLDFLQFHGNEPPLYLEAFKDYNAIRAVRVKDSAFLADLRAYGNVLFLFDTFKDDVFGGSGEVFKWSLLEPVRELNVPFFVSGGLTPDNVSDVIGRLHPFAVDVSSGVEKEPGKKDHVLVKKFIETVKTAKSE